MKMVGSRFFTLTLFAALLDGCSSHVDESVTLEYAKGPLSQAGVTSSLIIDDDWGTGFCGSVSIVNKGRRPVRSWQLIMQRNGADIGRSWAGLSVESRNHVVVGPTGHNASIPVGGTVTVPFCGNGPGRPALSAMKVDTGDAQS